MTKSVFATIVAAALPLVAAALDTTVSNEFWCTWGYANATPSQNLSATLSGAVLQGFTSCGSASFADFQPRSFTCRAADPLRSFNSNAPKGAVLVFR